jgi:hypothetical protein
MVYTNYLYLFMVILGMVYGLVLPTLVQKSLWFFPWDFLNPLALPAFPRLGLRCRWPNAKPGAMWKIEPLAD